MTRVVVRHRAEAGVEEARRWYARENEQLAINFVDEFRRTIKRISDVPLQFPEIGRGIRRALLHRFP